MLWIIRVFSSWRRRPSVWQPIHSLISSKLKHFRQGILTQVFAQNKYFWNTFNSLHKIKTTFLCFISHDYDFALSDIEICVKQNPSYEFDWWILLPRYAVAQSDPRLPNMQRHEFATHVPWHSGLRPFSPVCWYKNSHCQLLTKEWAPRGDILPGRLPRKSVDIG